MDIGYWKKATRSWAHHALNTPGFVRNVAEAGLREDRQRKLPERFLLDVYPDAENHTVDMGHTRFRRSNLDPMERYTLGVLARIKQPRRIFEIGTYDGATTLLLARNAPGAAVFTLDLPPDAATVATVADEVANAAGGVGRTFVDELEAERITQLFGDSTTFDFSPWFGTVDLVLVDAGHDYRSAAADTATALQLVAPTGVVVWDDYIPGWPGVCRAVDEAALPGFHPSGTGFAVYDRSL